MSDQDRRRELALDVTREQAIEWCRKRQREAGEDGHHGNCVMFSRVATLLEQSPDPCSVCAGTGKPVSGGDCICGGNGTIHGELDGLRQECLRRREQSPGEKDETGCDDEAILRLVMALKREFCQCRGDYDALAEKCTPCSAAAALLRSNRPTQSPAEAIDAAIIELLPDGWNLDAIYWLMPDGVGVDLRYVNTTMTVSGENLYNKVGQAIAAAAETARAEDE